MTEQLAVRLDTSTRIAVRDSGEAADIEWYAKADDEARHAFPRQDEGFPPPAICGVRWTVLYGRHGNAWCERCMAGLRVRIRAATAALAEVERADLAAGDHFARPEPR